MKRVQGIRMELSILLAKNIIGMFLMSIVGYVIVKIKLFKAKDSKVLSKLIVYIICPSVTLNSFQMDYSTSKMQGLILAIIASILVHVIIIPLTKVMGNVFELNNIEKASIVYSNAGNIIIPLVAVVLGQEWVFYTCAFIMVQTILVWTHGKSVICEERGSGLKKILLNPNIIAIVVGLFMFLTGVRFPLVMKSCVSGFAGMIGPTSMLVVGMLIGEMDLKLVFKKKRSYFITLCRLVLLPLLVIMLCKGIMMFHIHQDMKQILLIVLLQSSAPVASMVTQLAQVYDQDANYASIINVMTVVFCVITMPILVFIYENII